MSWSFSGVGKPKALAAKMKADTSRHRCTEPEETIKNHVVGIVEMALLAMSDDQPVQVDLSGSQSTMGEHHTNQLRVDVKPLFGFVG